MDQLSLRQRLGDIIAATTATRIIRDHDAGGRPFCVAIGVGPSAMGLNTIVEPHFLARADPQYRITSHPPEHVQQLEAEVTKLRRLLDGIVSELPWPVDGIRRNWPHLADAIDAGKVALAVAEGGTGA